MGYVDFTKKRASARKSNVWGEESRNMHGSGVYEMAEIHNIMDTQYERSANSVE